MMVPKRVGRDCELSTTGLTPDGATVAPWRVTRDVLAHIDAGLTPTGGRVWPLCGRSNAAEPVDPDVAHAESGPDVTDAEADSEDTLRHWTSSGQCFYSDMAHVEAAGAETADPFQVTLQSLAVLRVCEAARRAAEAQAPSGTTYALTTANVDIVDPGISWGSHFNIAVAPSLWQALFRYPRDWTRLEYVSSVIAALVPFFGAGYVLPLRSGARFSLSARAHHLTRLCTLPTTQAYRRGLLNERRESHSDLEDRLHLIGFDFVLAGSGLLTSVMQCALAAAEIGEGGPLVGDPVGALQTWSYGLDATRGRLVSRARGADGRSVRLPTFVRRLVEHLLQLVEDGSIPDDVAPRAADLLPRIVALTRYLDEGSIAHCATHLDWAAKLLVLTDMVDREGLSLDDPRVRVADHDYASTDPSRGHFWRLWEQGKVDPLVSPDQIDVALVDGPEDGRGWGRGRLVRLFAHRITAMDWSYVDLAGSRVDDPPVRIDMPHTGSHSKAAFGPVMEHALGPRHTL